MSIAGEDAVTERRKAHVIEEQDLHRVDAYWRAANYLSVGQIYLLDNPLMCLKSSNTEKITASGLQFHRKTPKNGAREGAPSRIEWCYCGLHATWSHTMIFARWPTQPDICSE